MKTGCVALVERSVLGMQVNSLQEARGKPNHIKKTCASVRVSIRQGTLFGGADTE